MAGLNCKTTNEVRSCTMTDENAYATYSVFGYCVPEYDTMSAHVQEHWNEAE